MSYVILSTQCIGTEPPPPSSPPPPPQNLCRGNTSWGFYLIVGVAVQIMTGVLRVRALEARQPNFSLLHRVRGPFYDRCSFAPKRFKHVAIARMRAVRPIGFDLPPTSEGKPNLLRTNPSNEATRFFSREREREKAQYMYRYIYRYSVVWVAGLLITIPHVVPPHVTTHETRNCSC